MDQIEEVRRKIDIVQLVSEAVALKKAGRNFRALCPFHEEKTPSFMVSQERQMFKCFGCFPEGTKVKTPEALRLIERIKKNELVMTGKGRPKRVEMVFKRRYEGGMVTVYLRKLFGSVELTSDHNVFVVRGAPYTTKYKEFSKRYRKYLKYSREKYFRKIEKYFDIKKIKAGNVEKGDLLLYPINKEVEDLEFINLSKYITKKLPPHGTKPRKIPLQARVNTDFLKLLGYWIAEGSGHRAYIRFSLGNHEERFAIEIVKIIKKIFGLETSIYRRKPGGKTGIEITCCHSMLANIFENLCGKGAENKHIPYIFDKLPANKQRVLIEAILKGDGFIYKANKSNRRRYSITTISESLAVQLRDILLRLHIFPTEYKQKMMIDKKGVNHKEAFTINWSEEGRSSYSLIYKERDGSLYWLLPVWKLEKRHYKGKVYNLMVDEDHSYIPVNFSVGNCGEGGDLFKFLMLKENMEFGEALRFLAQKAGVELKDFRPSGDQKVKERLLEINHLASEFYHYLLTSHALGKKALQYLLKRGVRKDSIRLFNLGYSPNEWQGLINYLTKKKKYKAEELELAGLAIKSEKGRVYDRFRGRVMFPLFDVRKRVLGFSGRVMESEIKEAKYINSPETPLYHKSELLYGLEINKEEVKKANRAVVVEGELDMISSYQAGIKNVAAIKGSALTQEQIELLKRFCENVSLALDSDSAGEAASRRGIELAEKAGLNVRIIRMKFGKDPDECAQKSARLWKDSVNEAVPVYDFYLESGLKRYGVKTIEGKRKLSEEMAGILAKVDNEVIKDHYIKKLAKVLEVEEEAVRMEVEKFPFAKAVEGSRVSFESETKSRQERLEEYLLALILQADEEMKKFVSLVKPEEWSETVIKKILEQLQQWFKKDKKWEINKFVKSLAEELVAQVDAAYLLDLGRLTEDRDRLEREVEKTLTDIKRLNIKQKLEQLSGEISQAEKEKDKVKLNKLQGEFREMAKGLI